MLGKSGYNMADAKISWVDAVIVAVSDAHAFNRWNQHVRCVHRLSLK